jgi:hypothetical protein
VDCRTDNGNDGNLSASNPYPRNITNNNTNGVWSATASQSVWTNANAGTLATLYSGNYITYYRQFRIPAVITRMDVMKDSSCSWKAQHIRWVDVAVSSPGR